MFDVTSWPAAFGAAALVFGGLAVWFRTHWAPKPSTEREWCSTARNPVRYTDDRHR